ncbi:MAG TPA: hypothetical protein VD999_03375 [Vitreimonas sp.]|nr:hypothetical protein [Vitreimonas sp.]
MKSIYSLPTLQRILDRWGIGQIEAVNYFQNVGAQIWRHHIETNQGKFELYSYPPEAYEYAKNKLKEYLVDRYGVINTTLVHSFDRYHQLRQLSTKHHISAKQANADLQVLQGLKIIKAFRVYGSIFQIHLEDESVLVTYGKWSIQKFSSHRHNVVVDSAMNSKQELDAAIEALKHDTPQIQRHILKQGWFELYLSHHVSLHFTRTERFAAIEVHLHRRRNDIHIFEETEIYYTRDLE